MATLKQMGGEGGDAYKGNKSNMNLEQFGGEGGGKTGDIKKGSDSSLLDPMTEKGYCGPGRNIKTTDN